MALEKATNAFYAGYFEECAGLPVDPAGQLKIDLEEIIAYQTLSKLVSEPDLKINPSNDALRAVQAFQRYLQSEATKDKALYLDQLRALKGNAIAEFLTVAALLSTSKASDKLESFEFSQQDTLEAHLMRVAQYLLINQYQLAFEASQQMAASNDDSTLSKLGSIYSYFVNGNYKEAYLTCEDIRLSQAENQGSSVMILNLKASACIEQELYGKALEYLTQAYLIKPTDATTLMNKIVATGALNLTTQHENLLQELSIVDPTHPLIHQLKRCRQAFQEFN